MIPADPPAHFEKLRQYLDEAVAQLKTDMADQSIAYAVPADDVLALIKAVAQRQKASPWTVWEAWELRHEIPVHDFVRRDGGRLTSAERIALRKRLRDMLGYVILGILMTEDQTA